MAQDPKLKKTRNIGIIAHIDAGKTTVTERILYYTGRVHKMGEVHDGEATMDWMLEERERGITITSAVTSCEWQGYAINIIDTPGHVDFTMEVERSLRVLDGAIGVFCAVGGVEPQSETVWHQADHYKVPKIAFINKLDRVGADYFKTVDMIRDRLGATPLILQIPWGDEHRFKGVIDLIRMETIVWEDEMLGEAFDLQPIPKELEKQANSYHDLLLETLADKSDLIMEKYLAEEEIEVGELKEAIRKAVGKLELVPVFCGSALKNKGIQPLLDAIVAYLPSPLEVPPIVGHVPETGAEIACSPDVKAPFAALAFKVMMDQGRKMTYLRVYSGSIKAGDLVFNPAKNVKEKLARLLKMHSNKRERIGSASAGDIVAAMGLKIASTGDTLCLEDHPLLLESILFNEPVISMALEPKSVQDQDKLLEVLAKLADEDPTFKFKIDDETGQTVVSGMGELHLDILVGRIKREYNVDTNRGKPQVVYRETVTVSTRYEQVFDRELGGQQHFAGLEIEIAPLPRGSANRFENGCDVPELTEEYLKSIQQGILEAAAGGSIMGYPVIDVRTTLLGVQIKESSDELSFRAAANLAFKNAFQESAPVLLEPIMKTEVLVPEEFTGEVISDLNSRQGKIEKMSPKGSVQVVTASVPLSKMFGYSTALRSVTQGRATFSMQFSHYDKN